MENQLPLHIQNKWRQFSFDKMTPVQSGSYDKISSGQDIVAISPTGTGKTLAYILPLLTCVEPIGQLQVLVLVPSQELAQQVARVWKDWSELSVQTLSGGANLKRQIEQLKQKPDVIVATPGRLNDLAQQSKKIKFHQLKTIVLDEVDQLLQSEHLPTIRNIVKRAPSKRQLLFFSATKTPIIYELSKWFNSNPTITVYAQETSQVIHGYIRTEERKRVEMLRKLAQVDHVCALVFFQHVAELALVYEKLAYHQLPVAFLHSDMPQVKRQQALEAFRNGKLTFLLTTDVASRGLDIVDLPMVIHYDLPREKDIYVHRSGRTGRMGKSGLVLSLLDSKHMKTYRTLIDAKDKGIELVIHAQQIIKK